MTQRSFAEKFFLLENFRLSKLAAFCRDGYVAFFELEKAEQLGGIHNGQQIIEFKGEFIGQTVDVGTSAKINDDF